MKTILNKIARFSLMLIIPATFIMGCQEDLTEPDHALPPNPKIPIGQKK